MDRDWLKSRLRASGKTASQLAAAIKRNPAVLTRIMNGTQQATIDQAKVFAAELGVELPEMLVRLGIVEGAEARATSLALGEGDAMPYTPEPNRPKTRNDAVAEALGGNRPGVDVWQVLTRSMCLGGFMVGDFILVDTHQRDSLQRGDVCINQVYDWQTGNARTLLRRWEPPVLVAQSPDPDDWMTHVVDHTNVVIMGKVIGSWRA